MVFAVISDIHGNLEALEAVLADIEKKKISEVYCLGDIIGYGPNPKECVEKIMKRKIVSIKGNHTEMALESFWEPAGCLINPQAKEAIFWTRKQLGDKERDYLKSLDYVMTKGRFVFVHGDLTAPKNFNYCNTIYEGMENFRRLQDNQVLFIGHLHEPGFAYFSKGKIGQTPFNKEGQRGDFKKKTIINAGSVGQPRDHNPDACWVEVYSKYAVMHRVAYDYEKTQEKLLASSMNREIANKLAKRLSRGH